MAEEILKSIIIDFSKIDSENVQPSASDSMSRFFATIFNEFIKKNCKKLLKK